LLFLKSVGRLLQSLMVLGLDCKYEKHGAELLTIREHLSSTPVFWWVRIAHFSFYVSLCSEFRVVMSVTIFALKRCSVRLYLQLFVGGRISSLRWLCLFAYSGVKHILHCVFVLFFFVLCALCCQYLWIVHFLLSLRYSLTFSRGPGWLNELGRWI